MEKSGSALVVVIAGELTSPLKMLHLFMGAVNASYFIYEYGGQGSRTCKTPRRCTA